MTKQSNRFSESPTPHLIAHVTALYVLFQTKCLVQLLSWVCKAENSKLSTVAFRNFSRYLSKVPVEKFLSSLDKCYAALSAEEQMIAWEFIYHFLEGQGPDGMKQRLTLKTRTMETVTNLLNSKTVVPSWVSKNWSHVIKTYSFEDFNESLMAILQRQMLRSPEVTIVSE